jgi:hypothetical protein
LNEVRTKRLCVHRKILARKIRKNKPGVPTLFLSLTKKGKRKTLPSLSLLKRGKERSSAL